MFNFILILTLMTPAGMSVTQVNGFASHEACRKAASAWTASVAPVRTGTGKVSAVCVATR